MIGAFKTQRKFTLSLQRRFAAVQPVHGLTIWHIIQVCPCRFHTLVFIQLFEEIAADVEFRFVAGNKVREKLLAMYEFFSISISAFVYYAQPSISRPHAGRKLEIPVSKPDRIRANGVVYQIKIRDVVFAGTHDPNLGIFAIFVVFRSQRVTDNIIRLIRDLHVIPVVFEYIVNQVLLFIKIVFNVGVIDFYRFQSTFLHSSYA